MINKEFRSMLTKFGAKNVNGSVIDEFVLTHLSENNPSEDFLVSWDEKFQTKMMSSFNDMEWSNIVFKNYITNLTINFDGVEMNADFVGVKVSKKETMDSLVVKYDLIFHKQLDPNVDSVFATTYLKRKEMDENGKNITLDYETKLSKDINITEE